MIDMNVGSFISFHLCKRFHIITFLNFCGSERMARMQEFKESENSFISVFVLNCLSGIGSQHWEAREAVCLSGRQLESCPWVACLTG